MIKAIFWDFDGVIAESLTVKTDAFYELYLPFGQDIAEKVKKYHIENGGVSRFKKIELFQSEYLGEPRPIQESRIEELANKFSYLVLDKVVSAPYVEGVLDVLKKYERLDYYIITGTPTDEMNEILAKRGIDKYFKGVYGSPETKNELTSKLISEIDLPSDEILFIGDAMSDYMAAKENNTKFLLRSHIDNISLFKDIETPRINDFTEFDVMFNQLNK